MSGRPRRTFPPLLSSLGRALANLLAPPRCAACDEPLAGTAVFCPGCDAECPHLPPERMRPDLLLIPARPYDGPAGQAIRRLKYGGRADLARPLGALVADALERAGVSPIDRLVPVPLHRARLAERGYNQAALLARHAASELGTRAEACALTRCRTTSEQASLGRAARLANVSGAFIARLPVEGLRVVLLDDVVTTGSTAVACVDALRSGGAHVVAVACVARADTDRQARSAIGDRRSVIGDRRSAIGHRDDDGSKAGA